MSEIFRIADEHVERFAALDPVEATSLGIGGHDEEMTDYSPEGIEARRELTRTTLAAVEAATVGDERDRVAAEMIVDRLRVALDRYDEGEPFRDLRIIASPLQEIRSCFDLMPQDSAEDWDRIATRIALVPQALASYRAGLAEGLRRGVVAARRQAVAGAEQAGVWAGLKADGPRPFFSGLVARHAARPDADGRRQRRLEVAAEAATEAYGETQRWLLAEYAPGAASLDAVGADRYALAARGFCGTELDLDETYAWGWDELYRIEAEMDRVAERIQPGAALPEVIELLETDPARAVEGVEEFRAWLQDLEDEAVDAVDGRHFDIPGQIRRVEAMIAPPGGAAAMYYTAPSEDFSRPGRTWYPTLGKTRFPRWGEVSIAYHEGVPGHHLQHGLVVCLADRLSRLQRISFVSGHGEGWALYAERLMGELGFLDNPDYHLGQLRAQAMRAVRVIVDIGMHLQRPIPPFEGYHPGEQWTPELALPFVVERSRFPADFMASEVDRYLGWPGQAISYKVGERVWLEVREEARRHAGASFDLKDFHSRALTLGPLGLDQLRRELARV